MNGLFKYFSQDSYKLEKFTNRQILLTPPKYLNDPCEFRPTGEPPTGAQVQAEFQRLEVRTQMMANYTFGPHLVVPLTFVCRERAEQFQDLLAFLSSKESLEQLGPMVQEGLSKIVGCVFDRKSFAHTDVGALCGRTSGVSARIRSSQLVLQQDICVALRLDVDGGDAPSVSWVWQPTRRRVF